MPVVLTLALCSLLAFPSRAAAETTSCVSGEAEIRAPAGKSEIVIRTTSRLAGAIDSLTWDGVEFIDSFDHGRQLQSASNLYSGRPYHGETFNPTEAGSRSDGAGPTSTSRLLHLIADGNRLQTTTQMAFWLRPGEKSAGHPARNTTPLSNHLLTKRVRIGIEGLPHVIQYDVTFSLPVGEQHTMAQFEAVTGYMPARFSRFLAFERTTGKLVPLSDGPGEQSRPVVLSTPDGNYAMGVYSPEQPSPGWENAGYGRFRFSPQKVVKWNCVFRIRDRERGVEPGDYSFRSYVIVGDRETVRQSLVRLHERFGDPS
ncbi:hypothetical protein Mal4_51210 [Maioricimonas rarisocia]|uniref:Uncharacterized protein n=1 Tax=Maioricimonas rarisocia TaxID=2528026 RepID=A0A517ZE49_9PLAN|nr:hypothetical protein [Maioricimonas rarisocia]QDU40761.1 hypothetical protein Mal4_51210 [Maioricimonas rarisocia]